MYISLFFWHSLQLSPQGFHLSALAKLAYNGEMKKNDAIKLAGSIKELALLLGISQPAISMWKEDVPKMRVFQLRALKPEWFL